MKTSTISKATFYVRFMEYLVINPSINLDTKVYISKIRKRA